MIKKIFTLLIALLMSLVVCISASALGNGVLTVDTVDAKVGDTVTLKVSLSNNPGIIAMKISAVYDKAKLQLLKVENGNVFDDNAATFCDDLSASPFNMLWEDGTATQNKLTNDILVTLTFKVLDKTSGYTGVALSIDNSSTFNMNLQEVSFTVVHGGVRVQSDSSKSACTHSKTEWKIDKEATCVETGIKSMICKDCGETVSVETIPANGHVFNGKKTKTVNGKCDNCEYVEKNAINTVSNSNNSNSKSDNLTTENNPQSNPTLKYVLISVGGVAGIVCVVLIVKKVKGGKA